MINTNSCSGYAVLLNPYSRTIVIPPMFTAGVQFDRNVRELKFKFPKIVDNVDLTQSVIRINFSNSRGEKGQYIVTDLEPYSSDENCVTFTWKFSPLVTNYPGSVNFLVCAVRTEEDGQVITDWNTRLASICVYPGLEVPNPEIPPEEYDEIAQILGAAQGYANQAEAAAAEAKKTATYITPEQFGAKGDGVTDDTAAIKEALMQKKLVIGNGKYKITDSLKITTETRAIFTDRIIYTGDSAAIIITGRYSELYFYAIQSSAVGILFESTEETAFNKISVNKMICTGDCLYMHAAIDKGIFYNIFNFLYLDSGKNCIHLKVEDIEHAFIGENTFYGGKCHHGDWAVYCDSATENGITGVKLYNIGLEGTTDGIYFRNVKNSVVSDPRYAELMQTGTVIKMAGKSINNILRSTNAITASKIDYSELNASVTNRTGNLIDAVIWNSGGYNIGSKCYVCHDGLVIIPYEKLMYKNIMSSNPVVNITYEDSQYAFFLMNTGNSDGEVHLNASYSTVGINEIYVNQPSSVNTGKIYDSEGTLIFDGVKAGTGLYKLICHDLGGPDEWLVTKLNTVATV